MAFSFDLDNKGYIKRRESYNLEYKQNFQLGDNLIPDFITFLRHHIAHNDNQRVT